jgi:hypothetical protein
MPTARAAVQLAAAAHGIGEHRRAAQSGVLHSIQPCASSLCTTPAMPSTMLNHVDIVFVTPLIGAPEVDIRSRRTRLRSDLRNRSTPCDAPSRELSAGADAREARKKVLLCDIWSLYFSYALEGATPYSIHVVLDSLRCIVPTSLTRPVLAVTMLRLQIWHRRNTNVQCIAIGGSSFTGVDANVTHV